MHFDSSNSLAAEDPVSERIRLFEHKNVEALKGVMKKIVQLSRLLILKETICTRTFYKIILIFLVQEQNERALPGVPADPGGHAGVLHHHAHGGHLEAHHPVVRRQPHLQGNHRTADQ